MKKFIIIFPHTYKECSVVVKQTLAIGYLTPFWWGLKYGDHIRYAMIQANNANETFLSSPTMIRKEGGAIGLV